MREGQLVWKDGGARKGVPRAPCPYGGEICGDDTPVRMCEKCRHEAAMDI